MTVKASIAKLQEPVREPRAFSINQKLIILARHKSTNWLSIIDWIKQSRNSVKTLSISPFLNNGESESHSFEIRSISWKGGGYSQIICDIIEPEEMDLI